MCKTNKSYLVRGQEENPSETSAQRSLLGVLQYRFFFPARSLRWELSFAFGGFLDKKPWSKVSSPTPPPGTCLHAYNANRRYEVEALQCKTPVEQNDPLLNYIVWRTPQSSCWRTPKKPPHPQTITAPRPCHKKKLCRSLNQQNAF